MLNLLSVAAAYGRAGLGLPGAPPRVRARLPLARWHHVPAALFLSVILFGLSMDYHVFILTRVREAVDRGQARGDAVADGLKAPASVVTSAAVVMVAVFAIFGTLSAIGFKEMAVGLAVAVRLDATIVRAGCCPPA